MPPFAETEKQGEQYGADDEPFGYRDIDQDRSPNDPQDESRRDGHYIEDNNVLEAERVEQVDDDVRDNDHPELHAQVPRKAGTEGKEHSRSEYCGRYRESARGKRTFRFDGMLTIGFKIGNIIEKVDAAGGRAKGDEAQDGQFKDVGIPELDGKDQCGEDDEVLHPLVRAHGGEDVSQVLFFLRTIGTFPFLLILL